MNPLKVRAMAITLYTTCCYLLPESKGLKLGHKMNTEYHKKSSGKMPCWKPICQTHMKFNSMVFSGLERECCFLWLNPVWKQLALAKGRYCIKLPLSAPVSCSVWWNSLARGSLWELKWPEGMAHSWFLAHAHSEKSAKWMELDINEWSLF